MKAGLTRTAGSDGAKPQAPAITVLPPQRMKAYEEVAARLLQQIVNGERADGERLPNESALADQFGVSRATVREALRVLSSQDLIRTAKGAGGGSYVQVPSVRHISGVLRSGIKLLTLAEHVTVEELLEARELLEVPAARLAAARREDADVARLRKAIHDAGPKVDAQEEFAYNTDFHTIVLDTCGNMLLSIAAQPVFTVLMAGFSRTSLGLRFHQAVRSQHGEIADAIDKGDSDASGHLMYEHLEYLRPTYEKLWVEARRKKGR